MGRGWSTFLDLIGIKGKDGTTITNDTTNPFPVSTIRGQNGVEAGTGADTPQTQRVSLATNIPLPAGTNLLGKVGIDQTTPGTTDHVSPIVGQNGIDGNTGAATAKTTRVALADESLVNQKVGFRNEALADVAAAEGDATKLATSRKGEPLVIHPQEANAANSATRSVANGATQFVGAFSRTRSKGIVRMLTVLASNVPNGLGGTFIFEFSEDGVTATISETRPIVDFSTVRDFDLINAGEYYRIKFTPSRALVGSELVFISTQFSRDFDGPSVRLANQEIEEQNAAMGQSFAYLKAFNPETGKSVNIRPQFRSASNSTIVPLAGNTGTISSPSAGSFFRGIWFNSQASYVKAAIDYSSDVAGTVLIDQSQAATPVDGDESSVTTSIVIPYDPSIDALIAEHRVIRSKWVRLRVINGVAAQSFVNLDTAFLVTNPGNDVKEIGSGVIEEDMADTVQNVPSIAKQESPLSYEQQRATMNSSSGKRGANQTTTKVEDDQHLRPIDASQARQFLIGPVAARIDLPVFATPGKRRHIGFGSYTGTTAWAYGFDSSISWTGNVRKMPPISARDLSLGSAVQLWAMADPGVSVTTQTNVPGTVTGGTGSGTGNTLTSNDVRGSIAAVGQTLLVSGFAAAVAGTIVKVEVELEGRKQSGQFETGAFANTAKLGSAGAVGMVATANLTAGTNQFVVIYITREVSSATNGDVSTVTGGGLSGWAKIGATQNSDDNNRRIDAWGAYGNPTATPITVAFLTTPATSRVAALSFDGIDPTTPVQASQVGNGNNSAPTTPALASTNKGIVIMGVAENTRTATAGAGYMERSDDTGGAGGSSCNLMTETKAIVATGTETPTATLSGNAHWAAIGITLNPSPATNPVVRINVESPSGTPGPSNVDITLSSTTDGSQFAEFTSDRAWTNALINGSRINASGLTVGAAAVEIDMLRYRITDSTGATVVISVDQHAGADVQ